MEEEEVVGVVSCSIEEGEEGPSLYFLVKGRSSVEGGESPASCCLLGDMMIR